MTAITIRFEQSSGEYYARKGREVIGHCVYLKETTGSRGLWKYTVKGKKAAWTHEDREQALIDFNKKCNEVHAS